MKYLYTIICFIVLLIGLNAECLNAQTDFAPIGAKWYYDYSGYGFEGYYTLESDRDTILLEKECKVIKQQSITFDYTQWPAEQKIDTLSHENRIICFENNILYHFFENDFHTLCDFNAEVNDNWTLKIPDYFPDCDTTVITVDSVYQQSINSNEFKTLLVNQPDDANVGFFHNSPIEIIERIGPEYYLFGIPISANYSSCGVLQTDANIIGKLRCYYSDEIGPVMFGETDCEYIVDSFYLNIDELINADLKRPFYNNGIVYFDEINLNTKILICDISGKVIHQGFIPGTKQFNLNKYPSGLYVIKVLGSRNKALKVFVEQ